MADADAVSPLAPVMVAALPTLARVVLAILVRAIEAPTPFLAVGLVVPAGLASVLIVGLLSADSEIEAPPALNPALSAMIASVVVATLVDAKPPAKPTFDAPAPDVTVVV